MAETAKTEEIHQTQTNISIVNNVFNGNNFLTWKRAIKFALGARDKLSFVNGKKNKPKEDATDFDSWQKQDCMVMAWILGSISKDISTSFLYTSSSRELCKELEERYGEDKGTVKFQIQPKINSMRQGDQTVATSTQESRDFGMNWQP